MTNLHCLFFLVCKNWYRFLNDENNDVWRMHCIRKLTEEALRQPLRMHSWAAQDAGRQPRRLLSFGCVECTQGPHRMQAGSHVGCFHLAAWNALRQPRKMHLVCRLECTQVSAQKDFRQPPKSDQLAEQDEQEAGLETSRLPNLLLLRITEVKNGKRIQHQKDPREEFRSLCDHFVIRFLSDLVAILSLSECLLLWVFAQTNSDYNG